ncbi:MAG: hypothetical protein Q9160_007667 [Pyrenula sp. 1 TL-2023]
MATPHTPDPVNFTPTYRNDTYPFIDPSASPSSHSGLSVLITGASKGIGRATSLALASSGASRIAISARTSLSSLVPELLSAAKSAGHPAPLIVALTLDVSHEPSIRTAMATLSAEFDGRLDLLLNNAGYLETFTPIADSSPDEWWHKSYATNLFGTYLVTRACLPLLLASTHPLGKTVLNYSSVGAHRTRPGASAYQSAKFALCRFTEFVQAEYGEQGLLAMSVHPGGIPTELALRMPSHVHGMLGDTLEVASHTVVWLTSERREWLKGRFVSCNWDMEELEKERERVVKGDLLKMRMAV